MSNPRSGSFLDRTIRKVRKMVKDPATQPRYTDAEILTDFLSPAMRQIAQDVTQSTGNDRVFSRMEIPLVDGTGTYQLPPHVERLIGVGRYDRDGHFVWEMDLRGGRSLRARPGGPVFRLEGDKIIFEPQKRDWSDRFRDSKVDIVFQPGDFEPVHEGIGSFDGSAFDLASTASFGERSLVDNAYVGYILRFKGGTHPKVLDYRITGYNAETRRVSLSEPLDPDLIQSEQGHYELLPPFGESLWNASAILAASEIMAAGNSNSRFQNMMMLVRNEVKRLRRRAAYLPGPGNQQFEQTQYSGDSILRTTSADFFVRVH